MPLFIHDTWAETWEPLTDASLYDAEIMAQMWRCLNTKRNTMQESLFTTQTIGRPNLFANVAAAFFFPDGNNPAHINTTNSLVHFCEMVKRIISRAKNNILLEVDIGGIKYNWATGTESSWSYVESVPSDVLELNTEWQNPADWFAAITSVRNFLDSLDLLVEGAIVQNEIERHSVEYPRALREKVSSKDYVVTITARPLTALVTSPTTDGAFNKPVNYVDYRHVPPVVGSVIGYTTRFIPQTYQYAPDPIPPPPIAETVPIFVGPHTYYAYYGPNPPTKIGDNVSISTHVTDYQSHTIRRSGNQYWLLYPAAYNGLTQSVDTTYYDKALPDADGGEILIAYVDTGRNLSTTDYVFAKYYVNTSISGAVNGNAASYDLYFKPTPTVGAETAGYPLGSYSITLGPYNAGTDQTEINATFGYENIGIVSTEGQSYGATTTLTVFSHGLSGSEIKLWDGRIDSGIRKSMSTDNTGIIINTGQIDYDYVHTFSPPASGYFYLRFHV